MKMSMDGHKNPHTCRLHFKIFSGVVNSFRLPTERMMYDVPERE